MVKRTVDESTSQNKRTIGALPLNKQYHARVVFLSPISWFP